MDLEHLKHVSENGDTLLFIDTVIEYINKMSDEELHDKTVPNSKKFDALYLMRDWLLEEEEYERCALLKKIEDRINAEK